MRNKTLYLFLTITLISCLASDKKAPILPNTFTATGQFYSFDTYNKLEYFGQFYTKYNWDLKVERNNYVFSPESNVTAHYIASWSNVSSDFMVTLPINSLW